MGKRGPGAGRLAMVAKMAGTPARNLFDLDPSAPEPHPWTQPGMTRAERVIAFVESLPITKGYGAGEKVQLLSFQRDWLAVVYATDADGNRRVRTGLMSVARGQGKTVLAAMLCLAHFVGPECEQRGECYSAAATKEQSALIFAEMEAIIGETPWMAARINVQAFHKTMRDHVTGSIYRALASDGKSVHGLATSMVICDELAQWKGREMFDVLRTSMGKRREPLMLTIGTQSPHAENIMSELVDYAGRIDSGEIEDPSFHGAIYAAPEEAALDDPEAWRAANPALGIFVNEQTIREEAQRAIRMPTFEPAFRNLHLNQRVDAEPKAINPAEWNACGGEVDIAALRGRPCYAGLDLSSVRDLSALVLYFPEDDGAVIPYFWCPKAGLALKEEQDRVPYRTWAKQDFIEATQGAAIDKAFIARRLALVCQEFDVQAIAYDRWGMAELRAVLDREEIPELPLKDWGQGFASMGPAVNAFETALIEGKLRHAMHPVLRWCASNLIFDTDPAGGRKPSKSRSIDRIDGMAALIMACGIAAKDEGDGRYRGCGPMWI